MLVTLPKSGALQEYFEKRDFSKTPEPMGRRSSKRQKNKHLFVIQQHAARRMHYDFRLEAGGLLKSWAVPKGPSVFQHDKRLAMQTEDHPLDYAFFEGFIPKGQYGGGEVIVWDQGTYQNHSHKGDKPLSIKDAIKEGKILIELHGVKLKGHFALYRLQAEDRAWILVKVKDRFQYKQQPVEILPESVLSGFSIKDLQQNKKLWLKKDKAA